MCVLDDFEGTASADFSSVDLFREEVDIVEGDGRRGPFESSKLDDFDSARDRLSLLPGRFSSDDGPAATVSSAGCDVEFLREDADAFGTKLVRTGAGGEGARERDGV